MSDEAQRLIDEFARAVYVWNGDVPTQFASLNALTAFITALEANDRRYRWANDHLSPQMERQLIEHWSRWLDVDWKQVESMTDAIDAAMQSEGGKT